MIKKEDKDKIISSALEIFEAATYDMHISYLSPEEVADHLKTLRDEFTFENYAPIVRKFWNKIESPAPLTVAAFLMDFAVGMSRIAIEDQSQKSNSDPRILQSANDTIAVFTRMAGICRTANLRHSHLNFDIEGAIKHLRDENRKLENFIATVMNKPSPTRPQNGGPRRKRNPRKPGLH